MKKIITVLTAVLLLCATVFSMTSCFGKVDMAELKTELEELAKNDANFSVDCEDETGSKVYLKYYTVRMKVGEDDYERLTIIELANTKLAKLFVKGQQIDDEYEKDMYELEKKMNAELVELGEETDELEEPYDTVIKRKGTVVIFGSKEVYKKVF